MEFRDAQRIAVLMNDIGLTAFPVEGYHVKLVLEGKVYELRESDERS